MTIDDAPQHAAGARNGAPDATTRTEGSWCGRRPCSTEAAVRQFGTDLLTIKFEFLPA
ncbi:MAG TPA: hypothetical protein VFW97_06270 [Acidimicrobiia bacterium]|nr:hypothetical protein [Acidimicrobiia bacterium]